MAKGKGSSSRSRGLLSNPQVRAKALMNQAYTHPDIDKAIDLALQATQCWPDCAEALMFLAMYLPEDQYQAAGVEAAHRMIGVGEVCPQHQAVAVAEAHAPRAAGVADETLDSFGAAGWEAVGICPGDPRTFSEEGYTRTVATYEVLLKRPAED